MKINLASLNFFLQIRALARKELRQIFRDKQLLFLLIGMPIIQISLYSLALSPQVEHLPLGAIDYSNSTSSRDLISMLIETRVFDYVPAGNSEKDLSTKVRDGQLSAGMIFQPDFERRLKSDKKTPVQIFLDGVDANTAGIATGYLIQTIDAFNNKLINGSQQADQLIKPDITFAYNPGLDSKWFFVPGVIALVLNLVSTMVSSAALIREKDVGTLEQLLMTPVSSLQILLAKIIPLSIVLMVNVVVSLFIAICIYHVPFRGNFIVFFAVSLLFIFVGIATGTALATISQNQRQSLLTSFFVNLPVIQFSGALTPLESMPAFWRGISVFDPLRYYVTCVKAIMLKGAPLSTILPDVLALAAFAVIFLTISADRFRKQLR